MKKPWLNSYDEEIPKSLGELKSSVVDNLRRSTEENPNHAAVIFKGKKITYRDVDEYSNSFANALISMGVMRGDRIAIMLPNLPQTIISYYGILKAGGVVVNINSDSSKREIEHIVTNSRAGMIISLKINIDRLQSIKERTGIKLILTDLRQFFPFKRKIYKEFLARISGYYRDVKFTGDILSFWSLIRRSPSTPPNVKIDLENNAVIQYTGGTTGISKGAVLTHGNISSNVEQVYLWFKNIIGKKDRVIAAAPYSHLYGMTMALDFPVRVGATILVLNRFTAKKIVNLAKDFSPTFFPAIPSMYRSIIHYLSFYSYDFSSIKLSMSASAPLSREVQEKFTSMTGIKVIEGFGLAEASGLTHINPLGGTERMGTIGLPLPDTDARIVDINTGKELDAGNPGELIIKGPQLMNAYWDMPHETLDSFKNGMFYTGDIAVMDDEGFFTLVDRKKDIIFSGENRIYPREIEEVLLRHHLIVDAAAVGIPDKLKGEAVKVYLVLEEGKIITGEDIIKYCKNNLASYKVPAEVEFLKELMKTADGKIMKKEMTE
ncbi:MAG: long-chain fatty acid--CoA ligase [Deltaproteobacteria bacterium]|uniref:Long-chain fatty acid--CoA ligase n=1 Tax=Candidatus Zymogenus saltonus TaxID=2844893 RepID=A0A9D8KGS2_9DELT|nr:long-chain fatty acid--CoA ligase [Candidatus Zymogenus saltonus]